MYAINLNPILPVRSKPEEQAEMTTQLLFGEIFVVLEKNDKWLYIKNKADDYEGWIDRKMATEISAENFAFLATQTAICIFKPVAECLIKSRNETLLLPAGSLIHSYSNETLMSEIAGETYIFPPDSLMKRGQQPPSGNLIVSIAKSFLNAPYLWGGKTVFGIDCSGLVQTVFSICGVQLPRNASQQAGCGEIVTSLAETGDLAFFENADGKITHVGILIDNETIIHSSGKVKIEKINNLGIISQDTNECTHKLKIIKRCHKKI